MLELIGVDDVWFFQRSPESVVAAKKKSLGFILRYLT